MAKSGTGGMTVNGKEVARKMIPHTVPALFTIDETFDVESTPLRVWMTKIINRRSVSLANSTSSRSNWNRRN